MTLKIVHLKSLLLSGLIVSIATISPALAARDPRPEPADARVKTLTYHENEVYRLKGHYGFTTGIEFSPTERIETISAGDSESWQITTTSRKNIIFIKPLEENAETDMTVLTTKRIYTFALSAGKSDSAQSPDLTFRLKFLYPNDTTGSLTSIGTPGAGSDPLVNAPVSAWNFEYSYSGAKSLRPERAFDDGTFTYLQFKTQGVTPAVFAVDGQGQESLVNFTIEGPYVVIGRVGRQFTLRDGDTATCIFNDAFKGETGSQDSPAPVAIMEEKKPDSQAVPVPAKKPAQEAAAPAEQTKSGSSFLAFLGVHGASPKTSGLNE